MKVLTIYGKTSDTFAATLHEGSKVLAEYDGYPLACVSADGDSIELQIDIKTGKILNWKSSLKQILSEMKEEN